MVAVLSVLDNLRTTIIVLLAKKLAIKAINTERPKSMLPGRTITKTPQYPTMISNHLYHSTRSRRSTIDSIAVISGAVNPIEVAKAIGRWE